MTPALTELTFEGGSIRNALGRLEPDERGSVLVNTPGGTQAPATVKKPGPHALLACPRRVELIVASAPEWAAGLVIAVEGHIARRYGK